MEDGSWVQISGISTNLECSHLLLWLLAVLALDALRGVELEEVGEQLPQLFLLHRLRQARGDKPVQTALLPIDGDT